MATNFNTGVPSLDPAELKDSLKEFLQGQAEFNSYNFDGSALSTILDLLTKNTHFLSYVANMQARESFLSRAQIRKNVVEHAQRLSYRPGSKTCPKASVGIVVTPTDVTNLSSFITMPANTQFAGRYGDEVVIFTNQDEYILYLNGANEYVRSGVELRQGDLIQETFVVSDPAAPIVMSNPNIDISTLRVSVLNSQSDTTQSVFAVVESVVDVTSTSNSFFLYENGEGKYQIEFGDGVLGKSLVTGNVVNVEYVAMNSDTIANDIEALTLVTDIDGFVDAEVTFDSPSYGGSDRETVDQIKRWAPIGWAAQGRSVTLNDYVVNLKRLYPLVKSAIGWGGEDNDPPRYGTVFIAVNTVDGNPLVDTVKNSIKSLLKSTNVGAITPEIVNPSYVDLTLDLSVGYNAKESSTSMNDEFSAIAAVCQNYSTTYLEDFDRNYVYSELISLIKSRKAVVSCDIDVSMSKSPTIALGVEGRYTVYFNNQLTPGSVVASGFSLLPGSVDTKMYDDGEGTLKIDRLDGGVRKVISENAGTVNYDTGVVDFTIRPIVIDSSDSTILIETIPVESNIIALHQDILRVADVNVTENVKLRKG